MVKYSDKNKAWATEAAAIKALGKTLEAAVAIKNELDIIREDTETALKNTTIMPTGKQT
jgi:hypothetical protein